MIIFDSLGVQKFDVVINKNTKLQRTLEGVDKVSSTFITDEYIDMVAGDYITFRGVNYTLINEPSVRKSKTDEFTYNIDFYAPKFQFQKALMVLDNKTEYYLYGDLEAHLNHIITNINRVLGTIYTIGAIQQTSTLNIQYENISCLDAINDIVALFELEYWINGNVIEIPDVQLGTDTGLTFQFKSGLKNIERKKLKDNELCTRLYALGSTRNVTNSYGFTRLRVDPIERNVALFGVHEKIKIFEEVYPHRTGGVTSQGSDIYRFIDLNMPFDLNAPNILIAGVLAKLVFNSGDLIGYEFEILNYNANTKEFYLKTYDDENGLVLPNAQLYPKVGDDYVIFGINMPQSYITDAETELAGKAEQYLDLVSSPTVVYTVTPDSAFFRANTIELDIGDTIQIYDASLGVDITTRIKEFSQSIVDDYEYTISVGNKLGQGFVKQVNTKTSTIDQKINKEVNTLTTKYNRLRLKGSTTTQTNSITSVGNDILLAETKGLNFIVSGLVISPNYQDDKNKVLFSDSVITHFNVEAQARVWNVPLVLRTISDLDNTEIHYIYMRCNKADSVGEFLVSKLIFQTENNSEYYYFLVGVLSAVNTLNDSRTLNAMFVGGGSTSVNNVTNITNTVGDTADSIKTKYESNPDTNAFTDALQTKLNGINPSGNINDYLFGDLAVFKADGNIDVGTLEKNDIIYGRWLNNWFAHLLYDGVGSLTQLSSYRIITEFEITLYP